MIISIQTIYTEWSKKSRGAPGSLKRNSVPEGYELPRATKKIKDGQYIYHDIRCYEYKSFKSDKYEHIGEIGDENIDCKCVRIIPDNRILRILYYHNTEMAGAPTRKHSCYEKKLFEIRNAEWGRVKYNGRFVHTGSGNWYYHKTVVNICCSEKLHKDTYLNKKPDYSYEDMAILR